MANHVKNPQQIAVLLHLAHHSLWDEIASYLDNLPSGFVLLVNLVHDLHSNAQHDAQRQRILERFPKAWVTVSPNVGLDIGGTFYLIKHLLEHWPKTRYVLKLHSKSDRRWRRFMLNRLAGSADHCRRIFDAFDQNPRLGMIGSYCFPFDYMNLGYVLEYLERFEVAVKQTWVAYRRLHPDTAYFGVDELIAHSLRHGQPTARPEIDLDFYTQHIGDFRDRTVQPTPPDIRRMQRLGVMGKLPYYPGTCFWMRGELIRTLYEGRDASGLAAELESGWVSDVECQTRTHAWERLYTILAHAHGYELATLNEDRSDG